MSVKCLYVDKRYVCLHILEVEKLQLLLLGNSTCLPHLGHQFYFWASYKKNRVGDLVNWSQSCWLLFSIGPLDVNKISYLAWILDGVPY